MGEDRFDQLTRKMAGTSSRRSVLKGMGAAVAAGVAATVLKPFRADAACPPGTSTCGKACCPAGGACVDPAQNCCCAKGQAACGTACCAAGVGCADRASSTCGCPKGKTPCGSGVGLKCCNAGTACSPSNTTCQPVATFNTVAKRCCGRSGASCTSAGDCCGGVCISSFCSGR